MKLLKFAIVNINQSFSQFEKNGFLLFFKVRLHFFLIIFYTSVIKTNRKNLITSF